MNWLDIRKALHASGVMVSDKGAPRTVGGGDVSAVWQLQSSEGLIFLKTGAADRLGMFEAEAAGLRELERTKSIRVPKVMAVTRNLKVSMLALEWLDFEAVSDNCEAQLGERLAQLHRHTQSRYGWFRDNSIGLNSQINNRRERWMDFFREQRLRYKLQLASQNGFGDALGSQGEQLLKQLDLFFIDYVPKASLLHGDLWHGNWSCVDGEPVIFDPAVYYGDRETDLAMTKLFGGFGSGFYAAYEQSWPLDPGSARRLKLYQLYHVLNHLNLFGSSYLERTKSIMQQLRRSIA